MATENNHAYPHVETWVEHALTGPLLVGGCFLPGGFTFFLLIVLGAGDGHRLHPVLGGSLLRLSVAAAVAFALLTGLLIVGGSGLKRRREWGRQLLVRMIPPYTALVGLLIAWALLEAGFLATHLHDPAFAESLWEAVRHLMFLGIAAFWLLSYLGDLRRALRGPLLTAACSDEGIWRQALRTRQEWVSGLLSGLGRPAPEGEYAPRRLIAPLRVAACLALSVLWLVLAQPGPFRGDSAAVALVGVLGTAVVVGLHVVTRATWDNEELILRCRLGRPVRVPWSDLRQAELVLPEDQDSESSDCSVTVRLVVAACGRPLVARVTLDEAGRDFLALLSRRTFLTAKE